MQTVLGIIGFVTIVVITLKLIYKLVRYFFPKVYTYDSCPNDHDTMSRYGYTGICDKCGADFRTFEDDINEEDQEDDDPAEPPKELTS